MNNARNLKVIIIGDKHTGKSALSHYIINGPQENRYTTDHYIPTIGAEYYSKYFFDHETKLILYDVGGDMIFRHILKTYIPIGEVVIFMYSVDSPYTLRTIEHMYKEYSDAKIFNASKIIVVCNFMDLEPFETLQEEGRLFANKINAEFFEISVKKYFNLEPLIENIFYTETKEEIKENKCKQCCIIM